MRKLTLKSCMEADMKKICNKFILKIVCDKNDADYLTNVTELDAVDSEYFSADLFLKTIGVLKKLVGGKVVETFGKLGLEDIQVLYDYDTYGQDVNWVEKYVKPVGEYSILDKFRDWDSCVADLFPMDTENCHWGMEADRLNYCHTVKSVDLIWIDVDGIAWDV